jgi:hypothetical protein
MKFTSFILSLVASLFLINSTLALPMPFPTHDNQAQTPAGHIQLNKRGWFQRIQKMADSKYGKQFLDATGLKKHVDTALGAAKMVDSVGGIGQIQSAMDNPMVKAGLSAAGLGEMSAVGLASKFAGSAQKFAGSGIGKTLMSSLTAPK